MHHCGSGINCGQTAGDLIRRNIFSDLMEIGVGSGGVRGSIIESNVIKRFRYKPFKTRNYAGSIMCNGCFGLMLRNNVITENLTAGDGDGGPWPDCASMGIAMYGNTIYRISGCGFYIEAGVYGTVLRWNTVFENGAGIVFRANNANTAFENYSLQQPRRRACDADRPMRKTSSPRPTRCRTTGSINNGSGASTGPDRQGEIANTFDHNTYQLPPGKRAVPVRTEAVQGPGQPSGRSGSGDARESGRRSSIRRRWGWSRSASTARRNPGSRSPCSAIPPPSAGTWSATRRTSTSGTRGTFQDDLPRQVAMRGVRRHGRVCQRPSARRFPAPIVRLEHRPDGGLSRREGRSGRGRSHGRPEQRRLPASQFRPRQDDLGRRIRFLER